MMNLTLWMSRDYLKDLQQLCMALSLMPILIHNAQRHSSHFMLVQQNSPLK